MIFIRRVGSKPQRIGSRDLQKNVLKTKKLFQNLFQTWCLISTFNCPRFCNSFFAPSSRGRLAQLQEGAVAAQCFGRGFPLPAGMWWVLVPELTGLPWCETMAMCDHLLHTEVTCTPQRAGWCLGCGHWHCASHSQSSHPTTLWARLALTWRSLFGSLNLPLGALLMVMTHLEAWPAAIPPWLVMAHLVASPWSLFGDQGQLPSGDSCPRVSPSWVQSCAPQNIREGGRIWVVLELKADMGVVQPENMDVCTVSPSENKYR